MVIVLVFAQVSMSMSSKLSNPDGATPDFKVVHRLTDAHYTALARLLSRAWWRRRETKQAIITAAQNSDCLVALVDPNNGALLAFGRAITDRVAKALVLDVIVDTPHRGSGLGRALMAAILAHPALEQVRDVELYCLPEMRPFYERWGFLPAKDGVVLLRRTSY
jgi:GNAT superfamily N-acetyltransferase